MERRWCVRKPVQLDVDIYYNEQPIKSGHIKNLALEGAFLDLTGLPEKAEVAVELALPDGDGKRRLRGQVVHVHSNGVGVRFQDLDVRTVSMFRNVLYG